MTKKILITGGNSFIGKSIVQSSIFKDYQVWHPGRHVLDINNLEYLKIQLKHFKPDFIIHTAWEGNSYENDNEKSFYNNVQMLQNLLNCKDYYNKMVLFGSGIEWVNNVKENMKYYHESKLVTALMARGQDKLIKLNLWNVFGKLEDSRRFISTCINNCKENKDIIINEDKLFDFFYIEDLIKIINYLIENPPDYFIEMDCVYTEKLMLSQIANYIKELTNSKSNIIINKQSDDNYIGKSNLSLGYDGLQLEIQKMI